jgi:two-component system, cell cycle response regulator
MKQILVIDDSQPIHVLVKTLLADEQVQIHSASNGEQGLQMADSLRPDLILLDVEMPGIDGYEVCKRLKTNADIFNIPVIFLTAMSTPEQKVHGLELGAVDYVTKPFNPAELLARVRASLRTHGLIQLLEQKALVDFLTGLGNVAMFKQRLAAEISMRARTGNDLAVIVVDVDDFQNINDTQGHPFGDRVLQKIATILAGLCRAEDVPCRLGGDAFVILTPNTPTPEATRLAHRVVAGLQNLELNLRGFPVKIKCSVALAPSLDEFDHMMLERANQAIDDSREQGASGLATPATSNSPVSTAA